MLRFLILGAVLVHGGLTFIAFEKHGYGGFFPPFDSSNTTQIFSDLFIALCLVNVWVFVDLKRHRKPLSLFVIHALLTIGFGSFAPLSYLLFRNRLVGMRALST